MVKDEIEKKLYKIFKPTVLNIVDESEKHRGHAGWREQGETHFHVMIISDEFSGMSRVKRHQAVYSALDEEMKQSIHALSLDIRSE